jgi:Post-segregation antitoxin CcdA
MAQSSQKRRISVTIDAELLSIVDQLTDNRSAAFEEALRLWRTQKLQDQLKTFYQQRSQSADDEEVEWVRDTQDGAITHWDNEFPWEDEASS